MNSISFFKQFLRDPGQIGAAMPSGPQLCRLLAWIAGVKDADVIVECGTGTGVVTEEIVRQKTTAARLIGFEINPNFAAATRRRCPEAEVVNDSATEAAQRLKERGLDGCDCIVSGLPWAAFPEPLQDELLDVAFGVLRPGGRFVTFAYLHGLVLPAAQRFRNKLNQRFAAVGMTPVVWSNVPPALVYWADKERTTASSPFSRPALWTETSVRALLEGMAGPRDQARSKTAHRIVEAAAEVFVERGYKRATMQAIAKRAGVVKSKLHAYARSKAELLLMAIAAEKLAGLEEWLPILDEQRPAEERMRLYVRMLMTRAQHSPLLHRLRSRDSDFFLAAEDLQERVKRELLELGTDFHEHLLEQLAPRQLSPEEKRKRAKVLMMLDNMASVLTDPQVRQGLELEEVAAIISEIVVDGLAPRADTGTDANGWAPSPRPSGKNGSS